MQKNNIYCKGHCALCTVHCALCTSDVLIPYYWSITLSDIYNTYSMNHSNMNES